MKKWHTVLWLVFVSMAIGSGITFVWRRPRHKENVATVNGRGITIDRYNKAVKQMRVLLERWGVFGNILGIKPEELALDQCIRDALIDNVKDSFCIRIDNKFFKEELAKSIPDELIDEQGRVNMDMYQQYLSRSLSLTPSEFEKQKRNELERQVIYRGIENSSYIPLYRVRELYEYESVKKSYAILVFPFETFVKEIESKQIDQGELKKYFEKNRENYRVPERRKVQYWTISPDKYAEKIAIDAQSIRSFYDKNKSQLYRIPPKIKVRRLVLGFTKSMTKEQKDALTKKASDVLVQARAKSEEFVNLVKKYSTDIEGVKNGGLTEFFSRGTYEEDFEKAAFRLQKPNDISPVISTSKGYEIIQLIERSKEEENAKPFESVKEEIEKTLRDRKALVTLRSDLEIMIHMVKTDDKVVDKFVKDHNLEGKESDWLSAKDTKTEGLTGKLAQKVFTIKRQINYGYFVHDKAYVIYKLSDEAKSLIPKLDDISKDVIKDFQSEEAEKLSKETVKKIRADILAKKKTLQDVAKEKNVRFIKTEKISKGDSIEGIDKENTLVAKFKILTDKSQILYHSYKQDRYLVQLLDSDQFDPAGFEKRKDSILKNEKYKGQSNVTTSFVASLRRNAKIEVDQKNLKDFRDRGVKD
jgi:peptidyl-prolyl cis-trans isomerase D